MKLLKYLFLLFIVGCSSTKVIYDYDSKTNFEKYKTFNFFEDAGNGLNELDVKRITNELLYKLQEKGMKLSDTPDVYINIVSKESEVANRNTIGLGIGGGGTVGFGISGGIPIGSKKMNQQLTIDFVERKNNELIWQGIAESEIKERTTPEERELHYKKVIEKVLVSYPPSKKN
ncbi:DUF4136 domain-containing protein [Tenacibaculum sp. Bg11-29]|uniref:DUF4136 domain-containing protein n=1 Tax=Tenacibaculum sp. Bg11-29 TaxID=2058306 RepID=UPI000C34C715|nr:DUF4136 domain-containing protein [Tenacibaculum sp. Bg11-29]PKH52799.1 DUF4136 domain-containing protein [Tenacibaculum sp. Bg11-29]